MDRRQLEYVSEFKYLGFVVDESRTDGENLLRNVVCDRKIERAIRFVKAMVLRMIKSLA